MSEYSFLTREQLTNSEVLKQRGEGAVITDFSILLGGAVGSTDYLDCTLEKRIGKYWTKSDYDSSNFYVCNEYEQIRPEYVDDRSCGVRPTLPLAYIGDLSKDEDGTVKFGHYPQTVAGKAIQIELEQALIEERLEKTGNTYTTDSGIKLKFTTMHSSFEPQVHEEYEYKGKRYIRVKANFNDLGLSSEDTTLSNGEKYDNGDYVWVAVEPIKWIVDEQSQLLIAEKILFAGIQFQDMNKNAESVKETFNPEEMLRKMIEKKFRGIDFETSDIKGFIDEYFSRDLEQSIIKNKTIQDGEEIQTTQVTKYRAEDTIAFVKQGVSEYDKIGSMYKEHLTQNHSKNSIEERSQRDDR